MSRKKPLQVLNDKPAHITTADKAVQDTKDARLSVLNPDSILVQRIIKELTVRLIPISKELEDYIAGLINTEIQAQSTKIVNAVVTGATFSALNAMIKR